MILGSHNSWSYLKPKHWLLYPFNFIAKCQEVDIYTQYRDYGVTCFDLRVKFDKNSNVQVCHGFIIYDIDESELYKHLEFLNSIRAEVRILLDTRFCYEHDSNYGQFRKFCTDLVYEYPNIKFWCGRNLYNWEEDYKFNYNPTCKEDYASVSKNKLINQFCPYSYAEKHNSKILSKEYKEDILLIDFVNIK